MNLKQYLPWQTNSTGHETIQEGMHELRADGDAIALLPYDDGTFYLKSAKFNKELIGGIGGYETEDGDKIVVDGDGTAVRELYGVPMLLAVDPTEHAAAVDPIKALVAHKNNIGEWLRVDKKGNVVEAGGAVEAVNDGAINTEFVEDYASQNDLAFDAAMVQLAKQGDLSKVYDIAPPAAVNITEDGELALDEATHIAVDQSKAADLMPKTMDTVELNTALDKARMEEHEEGKLMKYFVYGIIAGVIVSAFVGVGMFLMMQVGGGIF